MRGRQTRKMVLLAAALFLMCRLPAASVLMGQDAVMAKPASINPLVSASQASTFLMREHQCHDATGLQSTSAFGEDGSHSLLVIPAREHTGPFFALEPGRIGDGFVILVRQLPPE